MGGLKSFFTKIIPIIMLVCFICLGIAHTFETAHINDLTYMNEETINIGTEENRNEFTYYELDVNGYMQGINNDFLNRSIKKVIDLNAYNENLNNFNRIWENGYDIGDISRTIANAILLTINTIILPINILLVPLRIISGIILTGISAVGIKTNTNGIITTSLNAIIDHAAIPFIKVVFNSNKQSLTDTMWHFNNTLYVSAILAYDDIETYNITFNVPANQTTFDTLKIKTTNRLSQNNIEDMYYIANGVETHVYHCNESETHGTWLLGENYKYITIRNEQGLTNYANYIGFMHQNATQVYEIPGTQYYNQTYTWQQNAIDRIDFDISIFSQIQIESNGTPYTMYAFVCVSNEKAIAYYPDNSTYTVVYDSRNNGWISDAYKTFTIKEEFLNNTQLEMIQRLQQLELIAQ